LNGISAVVKILKKIKKLYRSINHLSDINNTSIEYIIRSNQLLGDARTLISPLISPFVNGDVELTVSFTTYSKRIHDVHLVVESIAQQTIKPNRLILWLDEKEFTLATIPLILHKQIKRGLEIRFCPNYRSYKKLIPTLELYSHTNIITIDDDILYPYDFIEQLVNEAKLQPDCIIAHQVHKMKYNKQNKLLPYSEWELVSPNSEPSLYIFPVGIGGVYYPVNSLDPTCLNINEFLTLAPNADDVWFKSMSLMKRIKCKKVNDNRIFSKRFLLIHHTQDIALRNKNLEGSENDPQISAVFSKYNSFDKF
tara:strand:- start:23725 stop:24651 length:927 start_codon:yes stop_codon:yes gene_type:complete